MTDREVKVVNKIQSANIFNRILGILLTITLGITLAVGSFSYVYFKDSLLDTSKKQLMMISRFVASNVHKTIEEKVTDSDIRLDNLKPEMVFFMTMTDIGNIMQNNYVEVFQALNLTANISLIDKDGKVLQHSDMKNEISSYREYDFLKNNVIEANNLHNGDGAQSAMSGIIATGYFNRVEDGIKYIGAYTKIAPYDWTLVVEAEENSITTNASKVRNIIILFGIISTIIATLIAIKVSKDLSGSIKSATSRIN